ncbi:MAG: glycosyltransferase [Gemmatimonadales bacterium]|nr:glycosyltransferase [Gemmatimonadales bacterium]
MLQVVVPLYGDYEEKYAPVKAALAEMGCAIIEVVDEIGEGFTKTVNRGLKKAIKMKWAEEMHSAPDDYSPWVNYVWVLNQDAVPLPGSDTALIERMEQSPKCGIAASMQVHPEDEDFITYGGSGAVIPGVHFTGHISEGQHLDPKMMQWANGASMLLRVEMLEEIGLLDENLTNLASDSDLSFRARWAGWQVWYEPKSRVKHTLNFSANPPDAFKLSAHMDVMRFQGKYQGELWHELSKEVFD